MAKAAIRIINKVVDLAPTVLGLVEKIAGKTFLTDISWESESSVYYTFSNYCTESCNFWQAKGDKFLLVRTVEKDKYEYNHPADQVGSVQMLSNFGPKDDLSKPRPSGQWKCAIVEPLKDLTRKSGDKFDAGGKIYAYYMEVNPEDKTVWLHYKATLAHPKTDLEVVPATRQKIRESISYPWFTDMGTLQKIQQQMSK